MGWSSTLLRILKNYIFFQCNLITNSLLIVIFFCNVTAYAFTREDYEYNPNYKSELNDKIVICSDNSDLYIAKIKDFMKVFNIKNRNIIDGRDKYIHYKENLTLAFIGSPSSFDSQICLKHYPELKKYVEIKIEEIRKMHGVLKVRVPFSENSEYFDSPIECTMSFHEKNIYVALKLSNDLGDGCTDNMVGTLFSYNRIK